MKRMVSFSLVDRGRLPLSAWRITNSTFTHGMFSRLCEAWGGRREAKDAKRSAISAKRNAQSG